MLEVVGHDHLADFRAHSATEIYDTDNACLKVVEEVLDESFLAKLINPAITPTRGTMPGYAYFDYDSNTDVLSNVQMTFLDLYSAEGLPKDAEF